MFPVYMGGCNGLQYLHYFRRIGGATGRQWKIQQWITKDIDEQ